MLRGGGLSASCAGMGGVASTKYLLDRMREMSACSWASFSLALRGGALFVHLPWRQVATTHRFDFPMTSSAHLCFAFHAGTLRLNGVCGIPWSPLYPGSQ